MSIELTRLDPTQLRIVIAERQRDGFAATDIDPATADRLERLFHRPINVGDAVREIIAEVRTGGDAALREWTYRIDGVDVERSRVDPTAMAAASPKPLITTLAPSCANARAMASPIPEVEPVTTAFFTFSMTV